MDLIVIYRFWIGRVASDADAKKSELWLWYDTDRWFARVPMHLTESLSSPKDAAETAAKDWIESGGPPFGFGGPSLQPGYRFATTEEMRVLDEEHQIEGAIHNALFRHEPSAPTSEPWSS